MAETNGNQAVTRAELRSELHALEDRLIKAIAKTQAEIIVQTEEFVRKIVAGSQAEIIEQTQEFVRDSQSELLRGFEAFANSQNTRIRKVQADLSNVDASTDQRLGALERRMMEIEKRLPLPPFPPVAPPQA